MDEYKIKKVKEGDAERIWEIRNHPSIRKNSGNSEFISLEKHKQWFHNKYFEKNNNLCFVLSTETDLAGYCRLDYDEEKKALVVSIAIDPENQSRGLGNQLLSYSLRELKSGQNILVLAEIKKSNAASTKLFEKNDFERYKEDDHNYYYQKRL